MSASLSAPDSDELLRRYEIAPPAPEQSSRGASSLPEIEGSLGGHRRADGSKMLTLTIGTMSQSRSTPFADDEAADMVGRFREKRLIPDDPALQETLIDLVVRASKMYQSEQIESFVLQPIYFGERSYRVAAVRVLAARSSARRAS